MIPSSTLDASPPASVIRFGACEIRLDTREVRLDGQLQPVRRRVFDLIVYLVNQRPRAVPHQELLEALWQRSEASPSLLARAVMEARRALGDAASEPQCIVSVHGVGYRFAMAVGHPAIGGPDVPGTDDEVTGELANVQRLIEQARSAIAGRHYARALQIADEVTTRADALGSNTEKARALLLRGSVALQTDRAPEAARLASQAMRIAKAEGGPLLIAEVHIAVGGVHVSAGDLELGVRHLRQAMELLSKPGHEADQQRCLNWLSMALLRQGEVDAGLQMCRRSIQLSAQHEGLPYTLLDRSNEVMFLLTIGDRDAAQGEKERAKKAYKDGLALNEVVMRDLSAPEQRLLWLGSLSTRAVLLERLDRLDEAWVAVDRFEREIASSPGAAAQMGQGNRPLFAMHRARLLGRSGRVEEGLDAACAALAEAEAMGLKFSLDGLYQEASEIAERAGRLDQALRWQRARCEVMVKDQRANGASLASILAAEMNVDDLQAQLDGAQTRIQQLLQDNDELRRRMQLMEGALPVDPDTGLADASQLRAALANAHAHARSRRLPMCVALLSPASTLAPGGESWTHRLQRLTAQLAEFIDIAQPMVRIGECQVVFRIRDAGLARAQDLCREIEARLSRRARHDDAPVDPPAWRCVCADAAELESIEDCVDQLRAR